MNIATPYREDVRRVPARVLREVLRPDCTAGEQHILLGIGSALTIIAKTQVRGVI